MQIYRQNLRIDGDFYNLLALSGRNLIKSYCTVSDSITIALLVGALKQPPTTLSLNLN